MQAADRLGDASRQWFVAWRRRYCTDAEYSALCHAGLGDVSQELITESMFRRAMAGEVVKKVLPKGPPRRVVGNGICERCKAPRDGARTYCQRCRAMIRPAEPKSRAY